jgi:polyisoprenoid-binding protein YceI
MEYKAKPEYEKCVAISTKASIREMILPGAIALIVPVIVGFSFGPEVLGGLLAGVTVSGVLMGMFQSNAGGAWDNAKKSFEKGVEINGQTYYKKSEPHKASVTGDTVGDPFKDTSGPSMNILIKLMSIVSLVIAPHIAMKVAKNAEKAEMPATESVNVLAGHDGVYAVDAPKAVIVWTAKKTEGGHEGNVNLTEGELEVKDGMLVGGHFTIDMKSIVANDLKGDSSMHNKLLGSLLSEDFFMADTFPTATLVIKKSEYVPNPAAQEAHNASMYMVTADLTIKGITKEIDFPVAINFKNDVIEGGASFVIDRTRWGISANSKTVLGAAANNFIEDEINFNINIRAEKE